MAPTFLISALIILFVHIKGRCCLRNVHMTVPSVVRAGDSLTMSCSYTTDRENLYSVKFYLGDTEFYRFLPRDTPPTRVFGINGVSLTESRLNCSKVTLHKVHRDMTGYYKCEVSADAPFFQTEVKSKFVTISEQPLGPPLITTDKPSYALGETIKANCTSRGGYPLANLTWLLNGNQAMKNVKQLIQEGDIDSSVLQLHVKVSPAITEAGSLRLRCLASQFSLYHSSADLILKEETKLDSSPQFGYAAPKSNGDNSRAIQNPLILIVTLLCLRL